MQTKKKASKGESRAASGKDAIRIIDAYLQQKDATLRAVAEEIRRIVKKTLPDSAETVNPWGIPTFDSHGPICFMMVGKNHVTFGFPRGTSLGDSDGLLEGTGKNLRHIKLRDAAQLRAASVRRLLLEAAALNRVTPLTPSMRVNKRK